MYFRSIPNFKYHSTLEDKTSSLNTFDVKNFFRRGKIRADIFNNSTFFTKYTIVGDERPDQVSEKFYGSPSYDWVILLTNNILDVYNEWPLNQQGLYDYMIEKYGNIEEFYNVKHYKTLEVRNSSGQIVQKSGLIVDNTFYNKSLINNQAALEYFDEVIGTVIRLSGNEICQPVSFAEYEDEINDNKRNIFVLNDIYLQEAINDLEEIGTYKLSSQYVSDTMKKTDNLSATL